MRYSIQTAIFGLLLLAVMASSYADEQTYGNWQVQVAGDPALKYAKDAGYETNFIAKLYSFNQPAKSTFKTKYIEMGCVRQPKQDWLFYIRVAPYAGSLNFTFQSGDVRETYAQPLNTSGALIRDQDLASLIDRMRSHASAVVSGVKMTGSETDSSYYGFKGFAELVDRYATECPDPLVSTVLTAKTTRVCAVGLAAKKTSALGQQHHWPM